MANQWRRGGTLNAVLTMIVVVSALVVAIPLLVACFVLGLYAIPKAAPQQLLYVSDGLIVGFVLFWSIGLVTELQRTETLSLSKFLHLPVSIREAFLINYISSLLRMSLIVFVPVMLGLSLALPFAKGIRLLVVLPTLAAFLLMVTALTYQFQGWLASLMSNPRRRRTVIVVTTAIFMLVTQLPNLINMARPWDMPGRTDPSATLTNEIAENNRALQAQELDAQEHLRRQQEIMERHQRATEQATRTSADSVAQTVRLLNLAIPLGWLPLGVTAAAEGNVVPAILGFLGMTLIGGASLWRAYRTTIRLYQGGFSAQNHRPTPVALSPKFSGKQGARLLEARLPWLSEPVSAIALAGLRSLVRSPEAKMMLLTPLVLCGMFGAMLLRQPSNLPVAFRPLVAIAGMVLVLFGVLQLTANQFGFDRDGFRVFVLCSAARRDILLGKNLAFAPLALGMAAVILAIIQMVCPLRLDHFVAMFPQFVSMYLLFCLLTNLMSIYTPLPIAAGSMKPANPKLVPVLVQMVMILTLFPLTQAPTLLPLGIEAAMIHQGWITRAPICLLLTLVECAAVVLLYRSALNWQGTLFQTREQRILETVTNRVP
jgi:hypothetical protein